MLSKQAILAEHRRLERLFAATRAALEAGDAAAAARALEDLDATLTAHFEQEDSLYYPVVASLRPDRAEQARGFAAAHARILAALAEVGRKARQGLLDEARHAFESFAIAFAAHEASEEEFLGAMEPGVHAAR